MNISSPHCVPPPLHFLRHHRHMDHAHMYMRHAHSLVKVKTQMHAYLYAHKTQHLHPFTCDVLDRTLHTHGTSFSLILVFLPPHPACRRVPTQREGQDYADRRLVHTPRTHLDTAGGSPGRTCAQAHTQSHKPLDMCTHAHTHTHYMCSRWK